MRKASSVKAVVAASPPYGAAVVFDDGKTVRLTYEMCMLLVTDTNFDPDHARAIMAIAVAAMFGQPCITAPNFGPIYSDYYEFSPWLPGHNHERITHGR